MRADISKTEIIFSDVKAKKRERKERQTERRSKKIVSTTSRDLFCFVSVHKYLASYDCKSGMKGSG